MTALRARYAALDELPSKLAASVVLHLHGEIEPRANAIAMLRRALLEGVLPATSSLPWPEPLLACTTMKALAASGAVPLCAGQPEVADEVIMSVLDTVLAADLAISSRTAHFVGIALAEAASRCAREASEGAVCVSRGGLAMLDQAALGRIRREATQLALDHARRQIATDLAPWKPRADAIGALREILGQVAVDLGWDLSRGILRAVAVRDVASLVVLVAELTALRDVVADLGRFRAPSGLTDATIFEDVSGPMRRVVAELTTRPAHGLTFPSPQRPLGSAVVNDIERSSDPARMVPVEAASLGHPVLEWAWHARRAEGGLLSYGAPMFEASIARVERERDEHGGSSAARRDHGPVIVCLDTSASMTGNPGLVAKAIVVHLLLVAHDEARRCHVFSFSGPGDVVEHALDLSPAGIDSMLEFLMLDFAGGTDVSEPLRRALARHTHEDWQRADLLLVSDGGFDVPVEIERAIAKRRRESNLRVHGLVIGHEARETMARLCDPLHVLGDWLETSSAPP